MNKRWYVGDLDVEAVSIRDLPGSLIRLCFVAARNDPEDLTFGDLVAKAGNAFLTD